MDDGAGWRSAPVVTAVFAFVLLVPGPAAGQDYFPGFEVAAEADVVHVTSNILARTDDDAAHSMRRSSPAEAESTLRRHEFNAVVLRPPVVPRRRDPRRVRPGPSRPGCGCLRGHHAPATTRSAVASPRSCDT